MDRGPATGRSAGSGSVLYVVPTLGHRTEYLAQCLDSLQSQDHPHLTVVLVTPSAADHVRAEAASRGLHWVQQRGSGISGAVNQGWLAHGRNHEFWAWLGDDDTLTPGSTRRAVARLEAEPRASMVYGRCRYVDAEGRTLHVVRPTGAASRLMRWGPNLVPQPGSVARGEAVLRAGLLDEQLRYAMDLDLFLRLQDVGPVRYLPEVLATFRWHAASTTIVSSAASEVEARAVRVRTWTGRRSVGRAAEPLATLAGRALHKLQRASGDSLH
ncbi:MAG: glycosyltransferase [Sporichthyaceae bacterium]|nr:glycosyltransferase [Sporichthyaceae bacterium]